MFFFLNKCPRLTRCLPGPTLLTSARVVLWVVSTPVSSSNLNGASLLWPSFVRGRGMLLPCRPCLLLPFPPQKQITTIYPNPIPIFSLHVWIYPTFTGLQCNHIQFLVIIISITFLFTGTLLLMIYSFCYIHFFLFIRFFFLLTINLPSVPQIRLNLFIQHADFSLCVPLMFVWNSCAFSHPTPV